MIWVLLFSLAFFLIFNRDEEAYQSKREMLNFMHSFFHLRHV
jgi:hypothetical protein